MAEAKSTMRKVQQNEEHSKTQSFSVGTSAGMPTAEGEDPIRLRAYELWQKNGCRIGHDLEDWLQAEAEITRSNAA